ncbi:hypothetical protein CIB84_017444 [Bambusicola thoracicus]|uniref:Uncharacterized protein n=2 Tax=Bambusicola thoracicus TaxID=9083 RepID=A0A2P4S3W6_BAMTH|nr:hypothetical protein CIB84_017667 [Bambusicola thoracicus]POI18812.1 hypothetical protein CIB84_017444 [Bambusicola thoracicus]
MTTRASSCMGCQARGWWQRG